MDIVGKELLFTALRRETTLRPAWVPFVGVHGGKLIGKTATDYLQSAEAIVAGQLRATELYRPDGLPIVFDLQMEAEVLGCQLKWADDVPPSVVSHPLETKKVSELPQFSTDAGRFPLVRDAMQRLRKEIGGTVALYGLLTGPFTLLSHLRGGELFMDMLMDPAIVCESLEFCTDVGKEVARFYCDNGADVIAVVDPMTSQISPDHFEQFVAPYVNEIFSYIRQRDAFSSLFVCGDATRNLEVMCRTMCDNVSIDENIPLELLRSLAGKYNKSFGGNLKLTTVLLLGTEADAMLDAIRCIDEGGLKGFVLAPGCDLPYATPEANLQAVSQMVHDDYQRTVARTTAKASEFGSFDDIVLPTYHAEPQVILDVITLDSTACAPCLYMLDAALKAAQRAGVPVEVREHKIKTRSGIGYMCKLNVKNIPTICIDGIPTFISQIPDPETLTEAIQRRYREKSGA